MKRIIFFLLFAASFVIAKPQSEAAKPGSDKMPGCCEQGAICQKLDLTLDQETQFNKLQMEIQKKQIDLRSKIQVLQLDIKELFSEESPNKTKIESKINEIQKYQGDMKASHLDFWFDVNKILTPKQQKVWKAHPMMMGSCCKEQMNKCDMMPGKMKRMGKHGKGMKKHDMPECPGR